jgi:hypothetical protein
MSCRLILDWWARHFCIEVVDAIKIAEKIDFGSLMQFLRFRTSAAALSASSIAAGQRSAIWIDRWSKRVVYKRCFVIAFGREDPIASVERPT